MSLQGNTISLRFRGPNRVVGNSNENNNSSSTSSTNSSSNIRQSSDADATNNSTISNPGDGNSTLRGNTITNATRSNINNTGSTPAPATAAQLNNQNQNNNQSHQHQHQHHQQQHHTNVNLNVNPTNNPLLYPGRIRFPPQLVPNLSHQLAHNRPPPLLETPHIHTPTNDDNTTNTQKEQDAQDEIDTDLEMKELECGICYDILQNPSHCGSCSARYCHSCLTRALLQTKSCPSCRKEISSPDFILLDASFFDKYNHIEKTCKYPNCNKKNSVQEIMHHDSVCEFKPMNCKYMNLPFGCEWYGPRKNLIGHYNVGCTVQKLAPLIEGMRQQQQLVNLLNARFIQERQASSQIRNQLMALESRGVSGGLLDFLHLIYACVCTPREFLTKAVVWRGFWNCQGLRCVVNNFVVLLTICLYAVKHLFKGVGYISLLLEGFGDMQGKGQDVEDVDQEQDVEDRAWGRMTMLFVEAILSISTVIIGGLFLICFVSTRTLPLRTLSIIAHAR
jgi:hypothetical protein